MDLDRLVIIPSYLIAFLIEYTACYTELIYDDTFQTGSVSVNG